MKPEDRGTFDWVPLLKAVSSPQPKPDFRFYRGLAWGLAMSTAIWALVLKLLGVI